MNDNSINPNQTQSDNHSRKSPITAVLQSIRTLFDIHITQQYVLKHGVFNEFEAAEYCRCPVESIRYHTIRTRKLTASKFSKAGLVFLKEDLDNFLRNARSEGYRDLS